MVTLIEPPRFDPGPLSSLPQQPVRTAPPIASRVATEATHTGRLIALFVKPSPILLLGTRRGKGFTVRESIWGGATRAADRPVWAAGHQQLIAIGRSPKRSPTAARIGGSTQGLQPAATAAH